MKFNQKLISNHGDQIHNGALAFMKTEYKYLLVFIAVLVVLAQIFLGTETAIAVIVGAACSSLAGFIGMYAATKANVRTATAAQQDGAAAALSVSFYGGSVMGLCFWISLFYFCKFFCSKKIIVILN